MSETLDLTTIPTEEPIVSEVIEDADEPTEATTEDTTEAEATTEDTTEPEATSEETTEPEATSEETTEAPDEVSVEELDGESSEPVAVEQVASEIRDILSDVVPVTETNNLCSLKTLIDVLTKWTENKINHYRVEQLLQEGTETDENLDNLEKFIEIFKIWLIYGGEKIKENNLNLFAKINEYTLTSTINIKGERSQVLNELIDLTIKKSKYEYKRKTMLDILDNL